MLSPMQVLHVVVEKTGGLEGRLEALFATQRQPAVLTEMATQTSPQAAPQHAATAGRMPPPAPVVRPPARDLTQAFRQQRSPSAAAATPASKRTAITGRRLSRGLSSLGAAAPPSQGATGRVLRSKAGSPDVEDQQAAPGMKTRRHGYRASEASQDAVPGCGGNPSQPTALPTVQLQQPRQDQPGQMPSVASQQPSVSFSRKRRAQGSEAPPPALPSKCMLPSSQHAESLFDSSFGGMTDGAPEKGSNAPATVQKPAARRVAARHTAAERGPAPASQCQAAKAQSPTCSDDDDLAAEVADQLEKHRARLVGRSSRRKRKQGAGSHGGSWEQ